MIALDLETVCNVKDCPGFGKSDNTCTDAETGKKLSIGHAVDPWRNRITCAGFWSPEESVVVRDIDQLEHYINNLYSTENFVMHNGSFDVLTLWAHGIHIDLHRLEHDTRLMAHTVQDKVTDRFLEEYNEKRKELNKQLPPHIEHRLGKKLSLKVLAPYFLGVEPFWEDPSNHDSDEYVLKDCEYTYNLCLALHKLMDLQELEFYSNRFMEYSKLMIRATYKGIRLDLKKMKKMEEQDNKDRTELEDVMAKQWCQAYSDYIESKKFALKLKYDEMEQQALKRIKKPTSEKEEKTKDRYKKLYEAATKKIEPFKLTSAKDRLWLFKEYFKYDVSNYQGKEATDSEVAERLMREGKPGMEPYIKWSKINKRLTSYYPNYRRLHIDGIIHPNFDVCGTRTGRLSSSNPNFQNIPPELKCLLIPREGYKFIEYDASQIEARLIALYTEDKLLQALISKGISLHSYNANEFLDLKCQVDSGVDEVKEKYYNERQATKKFNFSVFYGAGKNRIQGSFFQCGINMDLDKCKEIRKKMRDTYTQVFEYHQMVTGIFSSGEKIYNIVGRPVSVENAEDAYMKGFNKLIQGSASDLNLQAALNTQRAWDQHEVNANVLMLVHDSIRAEVPEHCVDECSRDLRYNMENFDLKNDNGKVELIAEGGVL